MSPVELAYQKGYRCDSTGSLWGVSGRVLKPHVNSQGYPAFTLYLGNYKETTVTVHRLQAFQKFGEEMFQAGIEVRHLDGNPCNASLDNIAIGTSQQNAMDKKPEVRRAAALKASRAALAKLNLEKSTK